MPFLLQTLPTASSGAIIVTLVQTISHKNIMRRQLRRRFAPLFCLLILASTILAPRVAQSEVSAPSTLAATVEGVIFTKDIPGVSVHLARVNSNPLAATFEGYTVMVQPDGTFRFEDVAPAHTGLRQKPLSCCMASSERKPQGSREPYIGCTRPSLEIRATF
jgi:hypothetical protein